MTKLSDAFDPPSLYFVTVVMLLYAISSGASLATGFLIVLVFLMLFLLFHMANQERKALLQRIFSGGVVLMLGVSNLGASNPWLMALVYASIVGGTVLVLSALRARAEDAHEQYLPE